MTTTHVHLALIRSLFVLAAAGTIGCSAAGDDADEDTLAREEGIIGGEVETAQDAVLLVRKNAAGVPVSFCSASMIAPTVVLTAAHCIKGHLNPTRYFVFTGTTYDFAAPIPDDVLPVAEVVFDTTFKAKNLLKANDVGLVRLAEPAAAPVHIVNRDPITPAWFGQPATLVGYGETDHKAKTFTGGTRRSVDLELVGFGPQTGGKVLRLGNTQEQSCLGDSGGPAFMTVDGERRIVGVSSYTYVGAKQCIKGGYYDRIDLEQDFVDATLAAWQP